jgi:hypothetical protein
MFTVEPYAGIRRAVMVDGLSRRGQLHSTLGYVSPMTFEARHRVERKGAREEERNAASSPGLGRRQTGASSGGGFWGVGRGAQLFLSRCPGILFIILPITRSPMGSNIKIL